MTPQEARLPAGFLLASKVRDALPPSTSDRHFAATWRSYWCRFFR